MKELPNTVNGRKGRLYNNECILLCLIWLRLGLPFGKIGSICGISERTAQNNIIKGLCALSECFEEFPRNINIPTLIEFADENDMQYIAENEVQYSQFIVDGKHIAADKIGSEINKQQYYSYKLHRAAFGFQCTVTLNGICVHVTDGERAGEHDLNVYKNNRRKLLTGLKSMTNLNPYIMADQGYVTEECKELVTRKSKYFNKYRLVVERYFGRMTSLFGIMLRAFPMNFSYFKHFVRALCFLTNTHIELSPLSNIDEKYKDIIEYFWLKKENERIRKHQKIVNEYKKRLRDQQLALETSLNSSDLDLFSFSKSTSLSFNSTNLRNNNNENNSI